jgi:hypothetical protein
VEDAPGVLKYTIGGLAALAIVAVASFMLVAALNKSDAADGPAPLYEIRIDERRLEPDRIEVPKGRVIELRLVNDGRLSRRIFSDDPSILEIPTERDLGGSEPVPFQQLATQPGKEDWALVRFDKAGTFQLPIQYQAGAQVIGTLTVVVE